MAIYHCHVKPLSRSSGRSAVAACAYRTGTRLLDERQGLTHDYTRRSGVEHAEVVLPAGADHEYWTRERLWNAAEAAEVRKDARTAREWEIALPEELGPEARRRLALDFAREIAARYGCAVDVAVHAPGREGDERNHHAHLLATTRVVEERSLGEKVAIELSDRKRLSLGLGQGRQEIEAVRALWAGRANQALAEQGSPERIDHRSLAAQREEAERAGDVERAERLDRAPEIKLGWRAAAMERRDILTGRGDQLRAVSEENTRRIVLRLWLREAREGMRRGMEAAKRGLAAFQQRQQQWRSQREAEKQQPQPEPEKPLLPQWSIRRERAPGRGR